MMRLFTTIIISHFILVTSIAWSKVIHVPGNQPTIQAGIDAASNGDTVLVADGTYTGSGNKNLDFRGKAIVVKSENGPENCIIDCQNNGRAFYFHRGETSNSVVEGFTMKNGRADPGGAGIYCDSSSPMIKNNLITDNWAAWNGGGIYCNNNSSAVIKNNIITGNSAYGGGGIRCTESSPVIENNIIKNNSSRSDGGGGGIVCGPNARSPIISNNIITNNSANRLGGGIFLDHNSSPIMTNNIIANNSANDSGGGIECWNSSSPKLMNNTITGNSAGIGGGIYLMNDCRPTIVNTILWNDSPQEIYLSTQYSPSTVTVSYSDVQGGRSSIRGSGTVNWGSGNINTDPLFVDPMNADYDLQSNSPCIDAGTSVGAPAADIVGRTRPLGAGFDMGAYESTNQQSDGDIFKLTDNSTADVDPQIIEAKNGSIWLVWRKHDWDLHYKVSSDGGNTWSSTSPLTTQGNNLGVCLEQSSDDRIWVAWCGDLNGWDAFYTNTSDYGTNWSSIERITTPYNHSFTVNFLETMDGRLWIFLGRYYVESTDNGNTWSDVREFPLPIPNGPKRYQTSDGKLWHVGWTGSKIGYSVSDDYGTTWSNVNILGDAVSGYVAPNIIQSSDGRIWITWHSRHGGNLDIYYVVSEDNGMTWTSPIQLTTDPADDMDSDIAQINNQIWIVWSSDRDGDKELYGKIIADVEPRSKLLVTIQSPTMNFFVIKGQPIIISAKVTDNLGNIVSRSETDVLVTFSNGDIDLELFDDGNHNDGQADDGIYANTWNPQNIGDCIITVTANHRTLSSGFDNVSGTVIESGNVPWPMFQHDAQHTGRSPYVGAITNELKWSFKTNGYVIQSPVIDADGTIYFGSYTFYNPNPNEGKLYALNPDGTSKWTYNSNSSHGGSPTIDSNGNILFTLEDGYLYCLYKDGTLNWRYQTGGGSAPVIGPDGTIYISLSKENSKLYAINPGGTLKWIYPGGYYDAGLPTVSKDGTIYCDINDKITAINPDGAFKWSFSYKGFFCSPLAIGPDGTIYTTSYYHLYALNLDGTLKWKWTPDGNCSDFYPPSIAQDGTIYISYYSKPRTIPKFCAISPAGNLKWTYDMDGGINASSIDTEGTIYVGTYEKLYALKPNGGLKWIYEAKNVAFPAIAIGNNGTIYTGNHPESESDQYFLFAIGKTEIHSVSIPDIPTGPSSGRKGKELTFSTGGALCSYVHNVQYRFEWGDGTFSSWDSENQNHTYNSTGTFEVKAQARCTEDTGIVSSWSSAKDITIHDIHEPTEPEISNPLVDTEGHHNCNGDTFTWSANVTDEDGDDLTVELHLFGLGDLNQNGNLDDDDLQKIIDYWSGTPLPEDPLTRRILDVDADGEIVTDWDVLYATDIHAHDGWLVVPMNKSGDTYTYSRPLLNIGGAENEYKWKITANDGGNQVSTEIVIGPEVRLNPDLMLSAPQIEGLTVTINGAVFCAARALEWDWGDGTPIESSWFSATHEYQNSGTYIVTVTAYGDDEGKTQKTVEVTVGTPMPAHWDFIANTGNDATIVLPTSANPNIDGVALASGDYIGVFTPDGLCCGYAQWQGQNMAITVWGDDDQTSEIDGFQSGELLSYRVYRASEDKEWTTVVVDYSQGTGYYAADAFMVLSRFDVFDVRTITLNLTQGWNMFSINVTPTDPNVETIMSPIVDKLVVMKNDDGETYIPEFGINDIGGIDFKEGYQANLSQSAALDVTGQPVNSSTPIPLASGWSMIGYLPTRPIDAATALASISDQLVIAKNNAGQAYIPQFSINDIGEMQPGQGYQVYLDSDATLIYPSSNSLTKAVTPPVDTEQKSLKKTLTEHFQFTDNTGENATVVVPTDAEPKYTDGTPLENGDEIGVFTTAGLCCGAAVWEGVNTAITVWGDDSQTDSLDGFQAGDTLRFRVWKKNADVEYSANVSYRPGNPGVYQPNGFSVLTELVADLITDVAEMGEPSVPSDFKLGQNYPNPFNPATTIEYHVPQTSEVVLTIYDLQGHAVRRLVRETKLSGYHKVQWDGRDKIGRLVASGMYFYQIKVKTKDTRQHSFVDIKKMIFMK